MTLQEKVVAAFAKKLDRSDVVAPASYMAFKNGKAADEGYVEKALGEKITNYTSDPHYISLSDVVDPYNIYFAKDDQGEFIQATINAKNSDGSTDTLLLGNNAFGLYRRGEYALSDITAQDIDDFKKFVGDAVWDGIGDDQSLLVAIPKDSIYHWAGHFNTASRNWDVGSKMHDVGGFDSDANVGDGFKNLVEMSKKAGGLTPSAKAALFSDTAFIEAVKETAPDGSLAKKVYNLETAVSGVESLLAAI